MTTEFSAVEHWTIVAGMCILTDNFQGIFFGIVYLFFKAKVIIYFYYLAQ